MNDPLADVPRETVDRLHRFRDLLASENLTQNLISRSGADDLWRRHIVDSAQLFRIGATGSWVDIGSGGGLPGLVIACLTDAPVTLVEPRRLRAEFLERAAAQLGLTNVTVERAKAERITGKFDTITARAVAQLDKLLRLTHHLSHNDTVWVLPKGRRAQSELAEARRNWQCEVRKVPSLTEREATILVLTQVEAKARP